MASPPIQVSRSALYDALGNPTVALAIESLIRLANEGTPSTAQVLLAVADALFPNGLTLVAGNGIVLDTSTPGQITVKIADTLTVVDDINAGDDINADGDIRALGELRGASVRLDQTPAAYAGTPDFSVPITVDGVTMYLPLSSTP